jgi:cytochrome c556
MFKPATIAILAGAVMAGAALAHENATGIIAERMEAMKNMGRDLKAVYRILTGSGPLDTAALVSHAETLHENCHKVEGMFPPGSIDHHSRALPVIWEKPEAFQEEMQRLHNLTEHFLALAASGDKAALTASFDEVRESCRTCHETFRNPEDEEAPISD